MKNNKVKENSIQESKEMALHYMNTLTDVARESFLILGADLKVMSANPIFYETFQVSKDETEGQLLFNLGNGQWNISELEKLLKEVLPEKKIVKNYEVSHRFETIGEKTMLLNAGQIDSVQLIILAIEDITSRKALETKLADHSKDLEVQVKQRTSELADRVKELEFLNKTMFGRELKMAELKKEIEILRKQVGNS